MNGYYIKSNFEVSANGYKYFCKTWLASQQQYTQDTVAAMGVWMSNTDASFTPDICGKGEKTSNNQRLG